MAFLDLTSNIQHIQVRDSQLAAVLGQIEEAINHLAHSTGAHPIGEIAPPAPIQNLNVKVNGEMAHAVITDNNAVQRNVNYFVEYANEPAFLRPYVEHLGTSRQRVITLPTNGDSPTPPGTTPPAPGAANQWYFRAYSQYPGSKPSAHQYFGGATPTPVQMTGATNLSLLPSTGSGTAAADGMQGHQGFGNFLTRSAIRPKRSVKT